MWGYKVSARSSGLRLGGIGAVGMRVYRDRELRWLPGGQQGAARGNVDQFFTGGRNSHWGSRVEDRTKHVDALLWRYCGGIGEGTGVIGGIGEEVWEEVLVFIGGIVSFGVLSASDERC